MKPNVTTIVLDTFVRLEFNFLLPSQTKKNDIKLAILTRYTSRFSLNDILT